MSKYLPFKCPVVNWWWCSSVYKAFQKVEKKNENCLTADLRKNDIFGSSHFCIFLIQMIKYLYFKCPAVNWWWFSSF